MTDVGASAAIGRRLDQWLWFARFVKSRSLAARLCADGAVTVNGAIARPNRLVRIDDLIDLQHHGIGRTLRVAGLGTRRGPAPEARRLYDETAAPRRLADAATPWVPLLGDDPPAIDLASPAMPRSPAAISGSQDQDGRNDG